MGVGEKNPKKTTNKKQPEISVLTQETIKKKKKDYEKARRVDVLDTQCISFTCFMTPTAVHCFKTLSRAITEMLAHPVEPCVGMGSRRPRPKGRGRLSPHLIRQWVTVPRGWQDSPITSSDSAKQGCRERWREGRAAVHGSCHFPWSSPQ